MAYTVIALQYVFWSIKAFHAKIVKPFEDTMGNGTPDLDEINRKILSWIGETDGELWSHVVYI